MLRQVRQFADLTQEDPVSVTETTVNDLRILRNRERVLQVVPARFRLTSSHATISDGLAGALVRALRQECGSRWSEVMLRVPGIDQLESLHSSGEHVALIPVVAALEEADALCGTDDRLFCSLVGEAAGRLGLNDLFQQLVGGAPTPEFLFDAMAAAWPKVIGQGSPRTRQVGRGYGRFEVRDQVEASFAFCSALAGILKSSLEHLGAQNVEVSKTACEAVGDAACVYNVTWFS
jgi:hypothetical protein